ncbi:MAG: hypothetical protein ACAH06_01695 [Methylophilaceae bacterium]
MSIFTPFAALLMLALHSTAILACGHCVEDKIAAVYDHANVMQALERKHPIAFFAIDGPLADGTGRTLETLAESVTGVDKGSTRVSMESAAMAVAFNPERTTFAKVQKALERKFSGKKLTLQPLRIMDKPAQLKPASHRQD